MSSLFLKNKRNFEIAPKWIKKLAKIPHKYSLIIFNFSSLIFGHFVRIHHLSIFSNEMNYFVEMMLFYDIMSSLCNFTKIVFTVKLPTKIVQQLFKFLKKMSLFIFKIVCKKRVYSKVLWSRVRTTYFISKHFPRGAFTQNFSENSRPIFFVEEYQHIAVAVKVYCLEKISLIFIFVMGKLISLYV